jgi:acyl-CoA synthetase (AMP-forming)/AMP-acid ligase II
MPTPAAAAAIPRALQKHARLHGERPAIIDRDGVLTFGQLWEQAHALAAKNAARPGVIHSVASASTANFFLRVAAAWLNGVVPMPVDAKALRHRGEEGARRDAGDAHRCGPWKAVRSVAAGTYRHLVSGGELPTVARKALAVGLGNEAAGESAGAQVALFATAMHLNGPFEFAVRHLLLGGTVALLDRFDPAGWTQFAAAVDARWAFLAPLQIARLLERADRRELHTALTGLRTLVHSAAACPAPVREQLLQLVDPHAVAEYYGAAEYDGTFARADERAAGALPIPGAQFQIVDAIGHPLPAGSMGIIEGRSTAGCFSHYADEACATAGQWRTVGDRGLLDANGRLIVTATAAAGRAIVGGVNVALAHVHAVVTAHPAIVDCEVTAASDDAYGQVVSIRVTTGSSLEPEALFAYCNVRLRRAERPRHLNITRTDQSSSEGCDHAVTV